MRVIPISGVKIVDGINVLKSVCGIFVKEILPGSLAERDGESQ